MLNGGIQAKIIKRLNIDNKQTLTKWLQCLNLLRNRCAHHSRIWNRKHAGIPIPNTTFFNSLRIDAPASERLYSAICVIWYLVKMIGPNSTWIRQVADLFDKNPICRDVHTVLWGCQNLVFRVRDLGKRLVLYAQIMILWSKNLKGNF